MSTKEKNRPDGFEKLPSRFQSFVSALESRIYALELAAPTKEPTRVKIVSYADRESPTFFPNETQFSFTFGDDEIRVKIEDGHLEIYGYPTALLVMPSSSNVVKVYTTDMFPLADRNAASERRKR